MEAGKNQRKSFLFPAAAVRLISWLREVCRVSTDSEVVRLGIGCLSDLMMADKEGKQIIIRAADGTEKRYHPVFDLQNAQPDPVEDLETFRAGIRKPAMV